MSSSRNTPPTEENPRKTKTTKKPKLTNVLLIVAVVILAGAGLGFLTASLNTMPGLKSDIRPPAASQFFDINGNLISTTRSVENRLPVSISKIPKELQNAFVAVEDSRFYQHSGVDPRGIMRAVWTNLTGGSVAEGGSTITQQLAKNALLSQERTIKRKIQEAILALQIEHQYTKQEILELYLNQIYFGQGAYGVEAAAQVYFNKHVQDLTLSECAMLAGIPKSPNYYSPSSNLKAAKERQATVLDQMVKYNYLDEVGALKAKREEIKIAQKQTQKQEDSTASYFIDYVTQILIEKYGADAVYKDGLKIYTTLDMDMQKTAEQSISRLPTYETDGNGLKQPQGALVSIEPQTGYIKAMVGGRGTDQFNRAVLAERQPGSAFKPFVYLAALENGMEPGSTIDDRAVSYNNWSPQNYDGRFHGVVTLRTALEHSLNIPAVKLAGQVGIDKPLYYAQQMGIQTLVLSGATNDRNLAMSLGGLTRGVRPIEIAAAYGTLANRGIYVEPTPIVKILDRNGKVIEQSVPHEKSVVNERSAFILTDMLRGVIEHGTGTRANIGRPAAGKTGTTSDYKDAWFVGYTPDLVTAVWIGMDSEGTLPGITGGELPAVIWKGFMSSALASVPPHDFARPSGVSDSQIGGHGSLGTVEEDKKDLKDAKDKKDPKDKKTDNKDPNNPDSTLPDKPVSGNQTTPTKPLNTEPTLPPPPTRSDGTRKN